MSKKVCLVEDVGNNPGRIYIITYGPKGRELAELACKILEDQGIVCEVTERNSYNRFNMEIENLLTKGKIVCR